MLNKNRNNKVQIQLIPSVEQLLIDVAEENCHVPAHKMIVVQELYSYIHFLLCKKIINLLQNNLKHQNQLIYIQKPLVTSQILHFPSATSTIDY